MKPKDKPSIQKQFQEMADIAQRHGYGNVVFGLAKAYEVGKFPADDFDSLKSDVIDLICKAEFKFGTEYLSRKPKDSLQRQIQKIRKKYL